MGKNKMVFTLFITLLLLSGVGCAKPQDVRNNPVGDIEYTDPNAGFSFQYPSNLALKNDQETVVLTHSVPYKHTSPCNMKDSATIDELDDFNVHMQLYKDGLSKTVQETAPFLTDDLVNGTFVENPSAVEKVTIGNVNGFWVNYSVEGCGYHLYYFPLSNDKTLFMTREIVSEFNNFANPEGLEGAKEVKGAILPAEADKIFNTIVASFHLK